ncbi:uncharacterized protein V1518DRAFT_410861 [Limtongia smithiae]|uniref:uncharacterized protein n=1 Tax=Limtongia smithiae TaxID=1125753 RepID=UPI0034CDD970
MAADTALLVRRIDTPRVAKLPRDSLPPAVAALLAVTSIPPPRSAARQSSKSGRRRRVSSKDEFAVPGVQSQRRHSTSPAPTRATGAQPIEKDATDKHAEIAAPTTATLKEARARRRTHRKQKQYSSELVELLTPPTVDDEEDDDDDASSSHSEEAAAAAAATTLAKSLSQSPIGIPLMTPATSPFSTPLSSPPILSSASSSPDSSPSLSPITPGSFGSEYFPAVVSDDIDSDSDSPSIRSGSSTSTIVPNSTLTTDPVSSTSASRHRKQHRESTTMYNDDPLCVAVDENGACIPAIAFVPANFRPQSPASSSSPFPSLMRVRSGKRSSSASPRVSVSVEDESNSMVERINSSLRSLKWIATSMARHQEEYMSRDEIEKLEEPRRSRSTTSSSSSRSRSQSATRRLRSESVPVRASSVDASETRQRSSLSSGGVTARSSARALTMQEPLSEKLLAAAAAAAASAASADGTPVVPGSQAPALNATAIAGEAGEATCIAMDTYDVQHNCLPIVRPREPRMNGEFLRILAMELEMRRHGKLSPDFYSGKARMVLAPRTDYGHLTKKQRKWVALKL